MTLPPNIFASGGVNRAVERRRDDYWLQQRLSAPDSWVLPIWRLQSLVTNPNEPRLVLIPASDAAPLLIAASCTVLLGETAEGTYFAVDLECESPLDQFSLSGQFADLRQVGTLLTPQEGALLAEARAMSYWHSRNRFCGECGSLTIPTEAGHVRLCTNPACGAQHFPRTDPAIIVLVTFEDRCLLGRQRAWTNGMYSVIAGFVEPGESLEDAVVREVMEETGVSVTNVRYHSSQPWPFPASIMLGFEAKATSSDLRVDRDELEDARWFTRQELLDAVALGEVTLPSAISISRRLIEGWLNPATDDG